MNPNPNPKAEIDVKTLLELRQGPEPVQTITDRLQAATMGPADHIRTKHEVKLFVEAGDAKAAEALLKDVRERLAAKQAETVRIGQRQGQKHAP